MSILVYQTGGTEFDLSTGSGSQQTNWHVSGVLDELLAAQMALTAAPVWLNGLIRQSARGKEIGPGAWEVSVRYGDEDDENSKQRPEPGTWEYSFETGQASHKVTQSIRNIDSYSAEKNDKPPELGGAVNVDDKGVNGTEIPVPDASFSITAYFDPRLITTDFFFRFNDLAYTINSDSFLGARPGDLLFKGITGRGELPTVAGQRVKPVGVTFSFGHSPTRRNIKVGDMTIAIKRGWDLLHVRYKKDATEKVLFSKPAYAWVDQMFEANNFSAAFGFSSRNRLR